MSSSTTSSASNSFLDTLKGSLGDIGRALRSGDVAGARKLLSSLTPRGSQGVDTLA